MYLQHLNITNFKNIDNFNDDFAEGLNCFTGRNGTGKTNILDAIHYLSFTKSYFSTIDARNIMHGCDFFALHGKYILENNTNKISCIQKLNHKKQFLSDDKPYRRFAEHIGRLPLIMISPYDDDLINDGSEAKRHFADVLLSQFNSEYLASLIAYNKLLLNRNNLLKQLADEERPDDTVLTLLDEQMENYADPIFRYRKEFFSGMAPIFNEYFARITDGRETVSIRYHSGLEEDNLANLLQQCRSKDFVLKYTSAGIHKDDVELLINGYPIKNYGSQGQQKSFIVALKLAQFDYILTRRKIKPLLLLDDIFDKLDNQRVANIIDIVNDDNFGQVFITDTDHARIDNLLLHTHKQSKHFNIDGRF